MVTISSINYNIENNNQQNLSTNKKSKRKCILTNALSKFNRNDEVIDDINAEHVNENNLQHISTSSKPMSSTIRSQNFRDRERKKRNTNQTTSETALQNHIVTDDINAEQHVNDVQNQHDETHPFEIDNHFMAFDHIMQPPRRIQNRTGRIQIRIRGPRHTFLTVDQSWDFDNPCEGCGKIYLLSIIVRDRHLCCSKAEYIDASVFPQLKPLPPQLKKYSTTLPLHFSPKSSFYNNLLSIGQISVDNGRGNQYEHIVGPHAVKMNGRVEHILGQNTPETRRGISYFTYCDADQRMQKDTRKINETNGDYPLEYDILKDLYYEQRELNQYAKEVFKFITIKYFSL